MWLFGSRSIRARLEDLEAAVKQLKTDRKVLETEWEGVYEKYRVAMSKMARRDIRAAEQPPQEALGSTNGGDSAPKVPDAVLLRSIFPRGR